MLSQKCKQYLKEVFGYDKISDIDCVTISCIRENVTYDVNNEYIYDRAILKEYNKYLTKENKKCK